jgi:hypothetical protein
VRRVDELRAVFGRWGIGGLAAELAALRAQTGDLQARAVRALGPEAGADAEFGVYSQFGEDGLIQWLLAHVPIEDDVFVEFGVEDYTESNTRFLLEHDNWRGLVIDGGDEHRAFLRHSRLEWRHQIDALTAFVDRDNIDTLIRSAGISGDIGLLSIDIDGNDLWVLQAIESITPRILITEYNSVFGAEAAVTVPYDPGFRRAQAHPSHLLYGASLAALERVAREKGYALVAGNKAANNAFWVRRDVLGAVPEIGVAQAWRPSRFRESRSPDGSLTLIGDHRDRLAAMRDGVLWDLDAQTEVSVADRFGV